MLTGHRPFETVRVQDLMKLHLTADVPNASSIKPALPPFVDLSIRRAMSKVRGERFTSAAAFVDSLAGKRPVSGLTRTSVRMAARAEEPEPALAAGSGRMVLYTVIAFVILAAVVIAGTVAIERRMQITPPPRAVAPARATVAAVPDSAITADTAFDVNSVNQATPGPVAVPQPGDRQAVSVDRTLFPVRSRLADPDAPGFVRVLARGGTARVRVDGRTYGFSPLIVRVGPGAHVVSLESSGDAFLPAQITISATSNDTVSAIFSARVSPTDQPSRDADHQPLAAPSVPAAGAPSAPAPDQTADTRSEPRSDARGDARGDAQSEPTPP
jgi:hypothetical protein